MLPLNGLKNIQTQFLAEAAKLFIAIWCDTDISLICKDRAGELLVVQSWPYYGFPVLPCFAHFPDSTISIVSHGHHLISSAVL